ncbi:ADP-heptose:LPS heptosyltransferase [Desulfocurvibacter africanus PCS]|uniref:ADP-heptose:LPS heptosyltransferase n=1 Tax=Desulfocurvibacter africanus PCS TaxID=1262666 RepID=M5PPP3_DESAF|nr:glycosyltransferase family 9 protein [Desulfocurvibacter africanus]EMG35969.1 ADP-heptose:LPS heptosyltransferase [Desulfocurvibacter africanus PCS]
MNFSSLRRILVCLRYGIGDVVMETPALRALRRASPRAHITALGAAPATELVARNQGVDDVVDVQGFGLWHWGDYGDAAATARVERWLDERNFDAVLDVSHAVTCVRLALWRRGGLFLDSVEGSLPAILTRNGSGQDAVIEDIRRGWGLELNPANSPGLALEQDEREDATLILRGLDLPEDGQVVAVSAVASSPLKRWPEDRLARVADMVADELGRPVLILAGPEAEDAQRVFAAMRRQDRARLANCLPLRITAAVLARCLALVCNDTGLLHMAAAVGTPALAVFGPTDPRIYLPRHAGCVAVEPGVACPLRRRNTFGPPACIATGRCLYSDLAGPGGCVGRVTAEAVMDAFQTMNPANRKARARHVA